MSPPKSGDFGYGFRFALNADSPIQSCRIAVFLDASMSDAGAPGEFETLNDAAAILDAERLSASDLSGFLSKCPSPALLVMGHGPHYPDGMLDDFIAYLAGGGDILWLGAQPFTKPWRKTNDGWEQVHSPIYPSSSDDSRYLGISPWFVAAAADLDPSEPRFRIDAEHAALFGTVTETRVKEQVCRLIPMGAGRRAVLGRMIQGASTFAHHDLFSMVEPGLPWNRGGGRIVAFGVVPDDGWQARQTADLIIGTARFLKQEEENRLQAGIRLNRLSVSAGTTVTIDWAPRSNVAVETPVARITDAGGREVVALSVGAEAFRVPTGNLPPGRYRVDILDGETRLGLDEWFSVIEPPSEAATKAEVCRAGEYAAFRINGELRPMLSFCGFELPRIIESSIPLFRDAGIHVHHLAEALATGWLGPGAYDWSHHDLRMEQILREDPDALLFPRIRLVEPDWWRRSHPDSLCVTEGGLDAQQPYDTPARFMSWLDPEWRRDTAQAMKALIEHSRRAWYRDRFIGVFYTYGSTGEWGEHCRHGLFWADHHPAFVRSFRDFLRRKYRSDRALADAWRDAR
ncbi:MAG: hypothetical protein CMJ18_06985, partial [Phycisphaeraceae bacterium]|nr:hypothetical protein [Phycisphaeraceae bacterium]